MIFFTTSFYCTAWNFSGTRSSHLPFEQALLSGTPECVRFVLDHYAEQLKGLPPGVSEFSLSACRADGPI